jgi:hypothetical protein
MTTYQYDDGKCCWMQKLWLFFVCVLCRLKNRFQIAEALEKRDDV